MFLDDENGSVDPVTASRLVSRLRKIQGGKGLPHFVFLSCCESASPKAEGSLGGLGQRLVRDLGVPAVLAMTDPVSVKSAAGSSLRPSMFVSVRTGSRTVHWWSRTRGWPSIMTSRSLSRRCSAVSADGPFLI